MFFQIFWAGMICISLLCSLLTGQSHLILPAALEGAANAVTISLQLLTGYLFFCGLIAIVKELKLPKALCRLFRPVMTRIFGLSGNEAATEAVCMNLSANLLGLGNAATPYGMEAARLLEPEDARTGSRHALYMLLIINATSIQLLPTTVLTLRIGAGSANPNAILLPSLLSTITSTGVGILLGCLCRRSREEKHAS